MSFSQDVKEELINKHVKAQHCQKAQLYALLLFDSKNVQYDEEKDCYIYNFTSKTKTININRLAQTDADELTEKICCKRAFLRGAFLGAGTISDPEKEYRFDIICDSFEKADLLKKLLSEFEIQARITRRRDRFVLYLKEGEQIAEMLNVLEAHSAMMNFENIRILREMRGSVNRQVNCETANINKAVAAAMKQIEDIRYIFEKAGPEKLDEKLSVVAEARLKFPDVTLAELGNLMTPPISKSAVNHRMRKISQIAEELKKQFREEP